MNVAAFDAFLRHVYDTGTFLLADGTWNRPPGLLPDPPTPSPSPEPEPATIEVAPPAPEDNTPLGYTRGDLVRMRKVEQLRAEMDRGLKP